MGHQPQGLTSSRDSSVQHVSPASVEAETSLAAGRGFLIFVPTSIFDRRICPCPCSCVEGETLKEFLPHKEREAIPKSEPGHIRDAEPVGRQLSPFAPVGAGQRFNDGVCGDGLTDQSRGARSFLVSCDRCSPMLDGSWMGGDYWLVSCRTMSSLGDRCCLSFPPFTLHHQSVSTSTASHQHTTDSKPGQLKTLYPVKARKNQPPPPLSISCPGVTHHHHTFPSPCRKPLYIEGPRSK